MDSFLASVERRAFRMAEIATGNKDEALDIVQDAMFALVRNYADRPESQYGPLFHRILQSKINDWYRRQSVRNRFKGWLQRDKEETEEQDAFQQVEDPRDGNPFKQMSDEKAIGALESALHDLPLRQQQCFMLRVWEEMSVAETAETMNCSQSAVKTHLARANQVLRQKLFDYID